MNDRSRHSRSRANPHLGLHISPQLACNYPVGPSHFTARMAPGGCSWVALPMKQRSHAPPHESVALAESSFLRPIVGQRLRLLWLDCVAILGVLLYREWLGCLVFSCA
jgi:hypothetical protein